VIKLKDINHHILCASWNLTSFRIYRKSAASGVKNVAGHKDANFQPRRLWVLKFSILPINYQKYGVSGPKFCSLGPKNSKKRKYSDSEKFREGGAVAAATMPLLKVLMHQPPNSLVLRLTSSIFHKVGQQHIRNMTRSLTIIWLQIHCKVTTRRNVERRSAFDVAVTKRLSVYCATLYMSGTFYWPTQYVRGATWEFSTMQSVDAHQRLWNIYDKHGKFCATFKVTTRKSNDISLPLLTTWRHETHLSKSKLYFKRNIG